MTRCRDCFEESCGADCDCRCHRCLYCQAGYCSLHEQSLRLEQTIPDVIGCRCDLHTNTREKSRT